LLTGISEDDEEEANPATDKKDDRMEEDEVRMEVDAPPKTDPYQFYMYTPQELDSFSLRDLVADVALYEGKYSEYRLQHALTLLRTGANCETQHGRSEAI
jgi:hypothetical protein